MLTMWQVRMAARRDAAAGIEADLDRLVTTHLGRPQTMGAMEDAVLAEQQGRSEAIEQLEDDADTYDTALAAFAPRTIYVAVAAVSLVVEVGASAAALGALGYAGIERLLLAFGLASGTLLLATAATRIEAGVREGLARWAVRLAVAAAYLVVIAAAAWIRATASDEPLSTADVAASAILLTVATGAPAIFTHWALARLHAAGDLHKRRSVVVRRRRDVTRRRDRARTERVRREQAASRYESEAQKVRATYLLELRRAQAELAKKNAR